MRRAQSLASAAATGLGHSFGSRGLGAGAAARAVQAQPNRPYSPEPGGEAWDPQVFDKVTPGERLRVLEHGLADHKRDTERSFDEIKSMLKNLTEGTTVYQQGQQKELRDLKTELGEFKKEAKTELGEFKKEVKTELGDMKRDIHTLVMWRHAVITVSAVLGATTTAAVGLVGAYMRFFA